MYFIRLYFISNSFIVYYGFLSQHQKWQQENAVFFAVEMRQQFCLLQLLKVIYPKYYEKFAYALAQFKETLILYLF